MKWKINNVIFAMYFPHPFCVETLALNLMRYTFVKFYRRKLMIHARLEKHRRALFTVFNTGTVIASISNLNLINRAVNYFLNLLDTVNCVYTQPKIEITNIVACGQLPFSKLDLEYLSRNLKKTFYDTAIFPALIWYNSHVSFNIFSNGRVICTGTGSLNELSEAFNELEKTLQEVIGDGGEKED